MLKLNPYQPMIKLFLHKKQELPSSCQLKGQHADVKLEKPIRELWAHHVVSCKMAAQEEEQDVK